MNRTDADLTDLLKGLATPLIARRPARVQRDRIAGGNFNSGSDRVSTERDRRRSA